MKQAVGLQACECHGIYSSTSRRCAEFAKVMALEPHSSLSESSHLAASTPSPLEVNLLEDLQEMDFGDWDGCLLDELYQRDGERMAAYWQNPWEVTPPNGETMASFEARIDGAIAQILDKAFAQLAMDDEQAHGEFNASAPAANIWVVTHGGVIRHLMSRALGAVKVVGFYSQLALPVAAVVRLMFSRMNKAKDTGV